MGILGMFLMSVFLSINLGQSCLGLENRQGTWEYLATLPISPLGIIMRRLGMRLAVLLAWTGILWVWIKLSLEQPNEAVSQLPINFLMVNVLILLLSMVLGLFDYEQVWLKRLYASLISLSILWGVWILYSFLFADQGWTLFGLKSRFWHMPWVEGPFLIRAMVFTLAALLPLLIIFLRALHPLSMRSAQRYRSLFHRYLVPLYALPWVWFIAALLTGGIK
jgi:hypothetical protein